MLLTGCSPKAPAGKEPETASAANPGQPQVPTRAQPRLPVIKLLLGTNEIAAELARTSVQWQTGMMFRQTIGEHEGMLFVFPGTQRASFYMKNTRVPLSCAYIDPEGTILEIHDLKPFDEQPVPASSDRVQYVLETAQGWFPRHQVSVGTLVQTERGTLAHTFFRQR